MRTSSRKIIAILLLILAVPAAIICAFIGIVLGHLIVGEPLWALGVLVWVLSTLTAWNMFEGKKAIILFLRKFGPNTASHFLKQVMFLGRNRFRLITLDDRAFQHVVADGSYVFWSFAALVPIILLALLVLAVSMPSTGATPLGSGQVNLLLICASFGVLIQTLIRLVRRGALSRIPVPAASALPSMVQRVRALQRWDYATQAAAAQMTLVTVDDSCWPAAVDQIARQSDIIVIDLSDPTVNLAWELGYVLSTTPHKLIIIHRAGSEIPELPYFITAARVARYEPDDAGGYRTSAWALLERLDERKSAIAG